MSSPTSITGEAVFNSYDGLKVEANGEIGFLTFHNSPLEFRSDRVMKGLLPSSATTPSLFIQSIDVERDSLWLIGLVSKITDFNKRVGILGACVCINARSFDLTGVPEYLYDILYPQVEDALSEGRSSSALSERLGILHHVPRVEAQVSFRMKPETELLHQTEEGGQLLDTVIEAAFGLLNVSQKIGRVIISPTAAKGTRPADEQYIHMVQRKVQECRLAEEQAATRRELQRQKEVEIQRQQSQQMSLRNSFPQAQTKRSSHHAINLSMIDHGTIEAIVQRQDEQEARLQRIERHLQRKSQAKAVEKSSFATLSPTSQGKDSSSRILLLVGLIAALILVLLLLAWLIAPKDEQQADPVDSMTQPSQQSQTERVIPDGIDCDRPSSFAERQRCDQLQ
ncbi:hypothetical protein [Shimia ponticola]|uniref:hypothetical protein n=1 Tax=Shimia ponticola TaxID=2582893 RepID=UPI0011BF8FCA|nr:hypothetical protein [Shimia ponticola]